MGQWNSTGKSGGVVLKIAATLNMTTTFEVELVAKLKAKLEMAATLEMKLAAIPKRVAMLEMATVLGIAKPLVMVTV